MPVFLSSLSTCGKQRSMDCIRLLGWLFSLVLPKRSSSSLSFRALTSSKVKPLFLSAARYFLTVFRDESIWAAINRVLRPWLFILKIFLILLMLIVKLAILDRSFALKRWLLLQHLLCVLVGQFAPKYHGQFAPKQWVSLRRNSVVSFIIISNAYLYHIVQIPYYREVS